MSPWRQTTAAAAERIHQALDGWRKARILYPTMPREAWDVRHWLPVFAEALRADAGFHAWADSHILRPLEAIDPLSDEAVDRTLAIIRRLTRLIGCLHDGRDAEALVWDVPRDALRAAPEGAVPPPLPESQLDDTDRALAREIRKAPGIYGTQLAERTHLSESNVHKRMARSGHLFQLGFHQKPGRKGYFPPEKP